MVYGEPFINSGESIPWLLSNAQLGRNDPPKIRLKKLNNGLIVAILGLIDPELYYDAKHSGGIISDPKKSVISSLVFRYISCTPYLNLLGSSSAFLSFMASIKS